MLARRTVTASDVPTLRTPTEMKPPTFRRRQAFYTSVATWLRSGIDSSESLFHFPFSFRVLSSQNNSSNEQDLPDTTLFRLCLSLGRFTEWQFIANRDDQLAISHRFGHELERFPVEFREYVRHLHRWILRGVLRRLENCRKHSSRLDLGDQLLGRPPVDRICNRIKRSKIRNRGIVVGCDHLIRADSLRLIDLPPQNPRDHGRTALLRSEYCRTPNISCSTYDENRLAGFDSRGGHELVAGHRHQRQRRRLDQIEPLGDFRQDICLHNTKFGVSIVSHGEHLVAHGKAFHSRPNLNHGPRYIDSYEAREMHGIKILG